MQRNYQKQDQRIELTLFVEPNVQAFRSEQKRPRLGGLRSVRNFVIGYGEGDYPSGSGLNWTLAKIRLETERIR